MNKYYYRKRKKYKNNYLSGNDFSSGYMNYHYRSLQDRFLAEAKKSKTTLEIYLSNEGAKHGIVLAFDRWSILLWDKEQQYLIFKSGIISIKPRENILYALEMNSSNFAYIEESEDKYSNSLC